MKPRSVGNIYQCNSFLIVEAPVSFETPARTFQSTRLRISDTHTTGKPKPQVAVAGIVKHTFASDGSTGRRKVKLMCNKDPHSFPSSCWQQHHLFFKRERETSFAP